jgi:hypothetical protein
VGRCAPASRATRRVQSHAFPRDFEGPGARVCKTPSSRRAGASHCRAPRQLTRQLPDLDLKPVWLAGVDGATFDFYERLAAANRNQRVNGSSRASGGWSSDLFKLERQTLICGFVPCNA